MPYKMSWAVPHRVVHQRVYGILTPEELARANNEIIGYMDDHEENLLVHHVLNFNGYEGTDLSLFKLSYTTGVLKYVRHPSLGWVIMAGLNPGLNKIGGLFYSIVRARFNAFESGDLNAVISFLRSRDSTLMQVPFDWTETQQSKSSGLFQSQTL